MAQRRKRITVKSAPLRGLSNEWMPLKDAFERIRKPVGSRDLAERDLLKHLQTGRLTSAARLVSRDGSQTTQRLTRGFWNRLRLVSNSAFGFRVTGAAFTLDGVPAAVWFFVRRRHLDKLYPEPAAVPIDEGSSAPLSKQSPGKKAAHDWKKHVGLEVARRALAGERMPSAPDMLQFCSDRWDWHPDERQMQRCLRTFRDLFN